MKVRRTAIVALACMMALLGARDSVAWDTRSSAGPNGEEWQAIYLGRTFVPRESGVVGPKSNGGRNEHSDLTELSLHQIGADAVIGKIAQKNLTVVDLNASLFRPFLRTLGTVEGPDANPDNPLEERLLPPVPQWAGVPDFGYSVDDWVNKHHFCPPRHGDGVDKCHVYFGGWLAAFNSSHFGQQSADTYALLHQTALNLAAKAAALRDLVQRSDGSNDFPGDLDAHRDKIEEAEMMAYYYEATAQHFLEDRWSTGHMWERYSAPDVDQNPYGDSVELSSEIGAASGLLHGSEAFSGLPDAVSSPYFSMTESFISLQLGGGDVKPGQLPPVYLSKFRLGLNGPIVVGMGDERLQDIFDGGFGAEFTIRGGVDVPVNVSRQRGMMMACLNASWAEVIQAVGDDRTSGGYGVLGIKLKPPYDGDGYKPTHTCTDMWLTNEAVAMGWLGDTIAPFATMGRTFVNTILDKAGNYSPSARSAITSLGLRTDWIEVSARVTMGYWRNPMGTNLAHGGLPNLGLAKPGGAYRAPAYATHTDLDALPDNDPENGLDKQALFGFFNRANAGYFCRGLAERLKAMRGAEDRTQRATCHYLADRAWAGTDPTYHGNQAERRQSPSGDRAHAICQLFQDDARISTGAYDEDTPEFLHPGYTPIRNKSDAAPYGQDIYKVTSASVGNWCDKIPVLNLVSEQPERDQDVVARQENPEDEITVSGLHLGDGQGQLTLATVGGKAISGVQITRWADDEIRFKLPKDADTGQEDILVSLVRADKVRSVGRFVVRLSPPRPKITQVVLRQGGREVYRDEGDPEKPGKYLLIGAGEVDITIAFADDMSKTAIDGRREAIALGSLAASGEWTDGTTWHGHVMVPSGTAFAQLRGITPLSVEAASAQGVWIDTDPEAPDLQPDVSRRVVLDKFPLYVKDVRVEAGGGAIYHAYWTGGDIGDRDSILSRDLKEVSRVFNLDAAKTIPDKGRGVIRLTLTGPVPAAPRLTIGAVTVALTGKGSVWTGTFDLKAIAPKVRDDPVPVVIGIADDFARNTDSDPRTVPGILLPPVKPALSTTTSWWRHYEETPGKDNNGMGGDDHWHKLGPPPAASLVVLLDGSGSMKDNGKMVNAKQGMLAALGRLPSNIEIGAVTFSDCGSIATYPFTRDKDLIKATLLAVEPRGGTPIAAGIGAARVLLETGAHPLSKQWSFLPFTDGLDTCGGDMGLETGRMNASIRAHDLGASLGALGDPDDLKDKPTDDPVEKLPDVPCHPMSRTGYDVLVRDGALHLDTITLVETIFQEIQGANGRCALLLTTRRFGVYYGASGGKTLWRINSAPSTTTKESVGTTEGAEAVEAFRTRAMAMLEQTQPMAAARSEIDRAVHRSLGK